MRILLIHNRLEASPRGGAEQIVTTIARALIALGHSVDVLVPALAQASTPFCRMSNAEEAGLSVYRLRSLNFFTFDELENYSWIARALWRVIDTIGLGSSRALHELIQKRRYDVICTHNIVGLGMGGIVRVLRARVPSIVWTHTLHDVQLLWPSGLLLVGQEHKLNSFPARLWQYVHRHWMHSATIVIAPSQFLANLYVQHHMVSHGALHVLANPAPIANRHHQRARTYTQQHVVLFVGKLNVAKGIDWLVDTWASAVRSGQLLVSAKLYIIGTGSLSDSLQKCFRNETSIHWWGALPHSELDKHLRCARALVVPSRCYENYPTVMLEAATEGLPIVSVAHGGAGELARKLGGQVFTFGDREGFISTLNRELLGTARNTSIQGHVTPETYVRTLMKLVDCCRRCSA